MRVSRVLCPTSFQPLGAALRRASPSPAWKLYHLDLPRGAPRPGVCHIERNVVLKQEHGQPVDPGLKTIRATIATSVWADLCRRAAAVLDCRCCRPQPVRTALPTLLCASRADSSPWDNTDRTVPSRVLHELAGANMAVPCRSAAACHDCGWPVNQLQ
eukprot:364495-Chlamydomonas_euryale.AAC.8